LSLLYNCLRVARECGFGAISSSTKKLHLRASLAVVDGTDNGGGALAGEDVEGEVGR
jgi:hypothetical protein